MTASRISRRSTQDSQEPRQGRASTCKTCTSCRKKKVKCDGVRPKCHDCQINGLRCVYPRDARRELRPSKARVQSLEDTVTFMLEHMRASGVGLPTKIPGIGENEDLSEPGSPHERASLASTACTPTASSLPMPSSQSDMPNRVALTPTSNHAGSMGNGTDGHMDPGDGCYDSILPDPEPEARVEVETEPEPQTASMVGQISFDHVDQQTEAEFAEADVQRNDDDGGGTGSGLSPCEARVAGVFHHEHGCVSSVHGLAGIMNPTSRERHKENISKITRKGESAIAESKARLISNAVLQKQREVKMYRQPQNSMDLDGCDPELARHLLDLHFNRQHYAYLVSYRPAMMESLANGGGPWANKLLLNAIFYSGTLYSDRECMRSDPSDTRSAGYHFYRRFRELLVEQIDKPSIPSAMAILLTSASLVSQGHSSAGWSLSGIAYRMILDLGCHMILGPDYQSTSDHNSGRRLQRDLEQEMRKRLYWGAYVTDTTQALYLGRPCMFASVEARVPLQLLDTFEELEDWQPYIDPCSPGPTQPYYEPQPAYAVSTFLALARLFQISTRVTEFYGLQTLKLSTEALLDKKRSVEWELENWDNTLPAHLRHDLDRSPTPPPHQITPHTTFHALRILLHRVFLEQGHLGRHSTEADKMRGEEACIHSALMIQKYVRAYRDTFTLRRAPFLLSYAIYSAVTVILRQWRHDRGQFSEPISFFWTCLNELQRGCNIGLKKPLAILQDMVHELQANVNENGCAVPEQQLQPSLDESFFSGLSMTQSTQFGPTPQTCESSGNNMITFDYLDTVGHLDPACGSMPTETLAFLNNQEKDISQDVLYGLFAPSDQFP